MMFKKIVTVIRFVKNYREEEKRLKKRADNWNKYFANNGNW